MTEVAFHFNAPDKLVYACRLLRKATGSGAQVVVTGETSFLQELDAALWNLAPHEFLAHGMEGCPDAVWQQSPVVLVCRSGITAGGVAKTLKKAGFEQVSVLDGGIAAWQAADLPLVKGRG